MKNLKKYLERKTNNMTREEFDKLYVGGKAIHCDTKEKAKEFLALADSVGYKWINGLELINFSRWEGFKEETCYEVTEDGLIYDHIALFKCIKHEIIEYTLPPKFKVGDKVRVSSTVFTTLNGEVGVIVDEDLSIPMAYAVKVGHEGWTFWFYEKHLEKVEEPDSVKIDFDGCFWYLTENELEKVEDPAQKEETIEGIIEEIEYHQKAIKALHDRLKIKAKAK